MNRRAFLACLAACALLAGCAHEPAGQAARPPIVFVHGNGDTAGLWLTTVWRFESNGWPRERLFALDAPHPLARSDDGKPQAGRSGTAEHMAALAAEVERVRRLTGADKVVLVGNSRGGNAIRNYLRNGGGERTVSHAILGGTPNHGVWTSDTFAPGSEFNGAGPFLKALNAPQGPQGLEVTPGVRFMTLRSDRLDKFTQPDGRWVGQPKMQTGTTHEGPALKGAHNVVLPGRDHREVSFHPEAFREMWKFLTGAYPARTDIVPEERVTLDGRVTGYQGRDPTNLPLEGARLEVYEVEPASGARRGGAVHAKNIGADGQWGPFAAKPGAYYEFAIAAEGFATTHIYRSPFPRSSSLVHMRPAPVPSAADRAAGAIVVMSRPRGYFGVGRDAMSLDGVSPPPGLAPGVPGVSASRVALQPGARPVVGEFNGERIAAQAWPAQAEHAAIIELHY